MYYRARYYDPVLKRFVSEDPIGVAGGLNLYGYVGGNPVNISDPTGESGIIVPLVVGFSALLGGGVAADYVGDKIISGVNFTNANITAQNIQNAQIAAADACLKFNDPAACGRWNDFQRQKIQQAGDATNAGGNLSPTQSMGLPGKMIRAIKKICQIP